MWIRSQDKKELLDIRRVKVSRCFGSKTKKVSILGYPYNATFLFEEIVVVLGYYSSIEEAINEVNNIQVAMLERPNSIYEMKNS